MNFNSIKIEIKWALIFIATTLLWMVIERVFGYHDEKIDQHAVITNIILIPAITVYVLALLDKRKKYYDGHMSYKQGLSSGLVLTAFVTLMVPVTQSIISLVITPDYFENVSAYSVENGLMTQEAADQNFTLGSYIVQGMIGTPIIGALTTLIVAIFTKKK